MEKSNKTETIGNLINESVFAQMIKKDKFNCAIKCATIFSFWEEIVGKKFSKCTKPYAIKKNKMFIKVESPVIAQELSFNKEKLIQKINSYSMPLDINIKEIMFDYKNFYSDENKEKKEENDSVIYFDTKKIDETKFSEKTEESIKKSVDNITFLDETQKKIFVKKIVNTFKARFLQK